jgi:glycosyltransferase involved in cell wall biosynthesis
VRILYFADIRFPLERANGIQTMETCYALAERGHSVDLVVRPDTERPERDPFDYYGLARHSRLTIEQAPVTGPAIPSWARRLGYLAFAAGRGAGRARADIVMTRDLTVAWLLLQLPSRAPLVYESHGYAPDVAAAMPNLLTTATAPSAAKLRRLAAREAQVWKQADGYVTITAGLAADLAARLGARPRLAVVPDGTRIAEATPDAEAPGNRLPCVAYAGHLYPWKGADLFLESIARVPGVRALVIGGHPRETDLSRIQALADRLGIRDRVTFAGQVPPRSVPAILAGADILALPNPASAISTTATSPLKLFEYMAAARAIVASDLPAIREVLTHDVNAWLVTPGDPDAFAGGIRRLTEEPPLRARLARAAREAVSEYSWSRRAERLETLFAAVLRPRP